MKKIIIAAVAALSSLVATAPAMAGGFTGPRVEARVGADSVEASNGVRAKGVTYGIGVGYDFHLMPAVIVGVEATAANSSANARISSALSANAKTDFDFGGRVGLVLGHALVYGRAAYTTARVGVRFNSVGTTVHEDGYRLGGGLEFAVTNHIYVKGEYDRSFYGHGLNRDNVIAAVGIRF